MEAAEVEEYDHGESELIARAGGRTALANHIPEEKDPPLDWLRASVSGAFPWTCTSAPRAMRALFQLTTMTIRTSPVASTTAASRDP